MRPEIESRAGDVAELTVVDDGQSDEGQGHAEEIEEERGGVLEGVFDEDEGGAPDEDDCQKEEVGEGGWAEAFAATNSALLGLVSSGAV